MKLKFGFKRDGDDPLTQCNSVTTCASAALIQIKAVQNTAFSDIQEGFVLDRENFGWGFLKRRQRAMAIVGRLSAHRMTLSQTLPCLMRILAMVKPKSDMIARIVIAPQT